MNFSRADWIHFFNRIAKYLLRDAWYPTISIGVAQAIVIPESGLLECLATAAVLLMFIVTAAMFCFAVGWGISVGSDD